MTGSRKPTRLFVDAPLEAASLALDADQAHYLGRVLRCRAGDAIVVFNARGRERNAVIESLGRKRPNIALGPAIAPLPEPVTPILLLQALVKSDAMDVIVQKATELGVDTIYAARTEFSVVRLDSERSERRLGHWHRIAASACEQSGRHRPPGIRVFVSLDEAISALPDGYEKIAFDVGAGEPLAPRRTRTPDAYSGASLGGGPGIPPAEPDEAGAGRATPLDGIPGLCLAVGPEGGFSADETELLEARGFALRSLGPRTLRAETAAIAALACAQLIEGDLGARV